MRNRLHKTARQLSWQGWLSLTITTLVWIVFFATEQTWWFTTVAVTSHMIDMHVVARVYRDVVHKEREEAYRSEQSERPSPSYSDGRATVPGNDRYGDVW